MLDEGRPRRRRVAYWVAYVAALLLTACGSGGGGSTAAPGAISVAVSGLASKAPIANATVTVYRLAADGTRDLPPLATATTGLSGDYALVMRAPVATPVAVAFTGGSYVDEATGATLSLGADDALEAYAQVPANGILSVNVTPLTTLAAALARKHVQQDGQSLSAAIINATAEISTLFDVGDILETTPPPLSGLDTASQNEKNYALFLAGFSQLAENDGTQTVFALIKAMAADLQADGILGNAANALTPQNLVAATDQFLNNTNYSATLSAQGAGAVSQPRIDIATIAGKIAAHTNHAPTAGNLVLPGFLEDTVGSGVLSGSDPDAGDILSFSIVRNGEKGTAAITDASTGSFTYTPQPNANGQDSFTYLVSDGASGAYGTVTVTIIAVNDAPVITSTANTSATQDTAYSYQVTASDPDVGDSLTYALTTSPAGMTIGATTGLIQWTPTNGDAISNSGNHAVVVQVSDNGVPAKQASQSFTIHVANINDPPFAANASFTTKEDVAYSGTLSASDPDLDPLTYSIVSQGSKGTVTLDSQTGSFSYTPDPDTNGSDSFTYKVNDGAVDSTNIATVSVTITPVTDSIMVVVAHPDDEALMAAGVMKRAHDNGDAVKVVIITNGDAQGKNAGLTREAESKTAVADKLGLSEDDIIFLGYPDSGLLPIYNDHPNATVPPYVKGSTGQSATYGNQGLGREDFHRYWTGAAADYNQANVVADLKELLNRYQPTQIYTHSPFDLHYDHRATYYDLRDAAQSLMKEQATFHPDVYTAIIHQPYLYPYKDKWAQGTTPTLSVLDDRDDQFWPLPAYGSVGTASGDLTLMKARFAPTQALTKPADLDLTLLDWADRLSLPVPAVMQDPNVVNNLKYQMIDSYVSQEAVWGLPFAFGKSDEVFWKQTWSRNIALRATITASSQNTKFFQGAANVADSIVDGYRDQNNDGISEGNSQAEWVTAGEREGAWVQLDWTQPYTINKVVLYDRPNPSDQVLSGTLSFSDGSTVSVGALPNDGSKYEVDFAAREVSWARFTVDSVSAATANVGLAEMEVWTAAPPADNQPPFFTRGPTASALTGGMSSTLAAPAYDREGDPITWTWQSQLGATITGSGDTVTYTPPYGVGGTDTVTVTISDGINPPITAKFALALDENNIAYLAEVTASSETPSTGQLAIKAVDGVIDGYPGDYTKEWATNGQGAGAWLRLEWTQCYEVDRVRLYDRPNLGDRILGATLRFSDGSTVAVGALPNDGSLLELTFPARCTDSVTLEITAVSGTTVNVGLAEIEVFGPVVDPTVIQTVLLRQDFDSGAASGWTPVDDAAATHTPSAWSVVNDQYQEDSGARYPDDVGIFGETPAGYELATYSRYDGFIHGDMDLRLQLRSDDIGVLGVMFG